MGRGADYLWYIPNDTKAGHRGDVAVEGHDSLEALTAQATGLEESGWTGALIGTGWGRPDTFTVSTALVARTTTFEPLIAVRPGYWSPAHFAASAATLDVLSGGRIRINIVSGKDDLAAYGDREGDQEDRYARTKEFMRLVRRLWTEEDVTYAGRYFHVSGSTVQPRIAARGDRLHPKLHFGGASAAKYDAHLAVQRAVKAGDLAKQPCEVCGIDTVDAHHDQYDDPLDVRRLCRRHHTRLHHYGEDMFPVRTV
ncbi:luciferase-like monooxygenase [Rhizobium sp. PP-F2F-G36]|nr:luciferase-like monooxygenase [Rhizobium sp. PP-F2F-G36]